MNPLTELLQAPKQPQDDYFSRDWWGFLCFTGFTFAFAAIVLVCVGIIYVMGLFLIGIVLMNVLPQIGVKLEAGVKIVILLSPLIALPLGYCSIRDRGHRFGLILGLAQGILLTLFSAYMHWGYYRLELYPLVITGVIFFATSTYTTLFVQSQLRKQHEHELFLEHIATEKLAESES